MVRETIAKSCNSTSQNPEVEGSVIKSENQIYGMIWGCGTNRVYRTVNRLVIVEQEKFYRQ